MVVPGNRARCASVVACVAASVAAAVPAGAADLTPRRPLAPTYDWGGWYFGGHIGYGGGASNATAFEPPTVTGHHRFGGPIAGAQVGYNYVLPSQLLLGAEADVSFANYWPSNGVAATLPGPNGNITEQVDFISTFRGRVGGVFGPWMIYGTGGLALAGGRFLNPQAVGDDQKRLGLHTGWTAGAGVEWAFDPVWTARLEYLYDKFEKGSVTFADGTRFNSAWNFQTVRLGLNRKVTWGNGDLVPAPKDNSLSGSDRWQIHGQTTYIQQGYPSFHSPYQGSQSLTGPAQSKNTVSATAFLGVQLWDGAQVFYAPEIAQGSGLSGTFGLGGFTNGEAQKAGFPYPHYNTSRLFIRQTFGLGGEQENIESDTIHFGGKVDVSRVTILAGRLFLPDIIDNNKYSDEPRTTFLNWSNWAGGAFDFPADQLGYSYGAIVELNQKNWAIRGGYLLMDSVSNSNDFDMHLFKRGEYLVELENRYTLLSRPGVLRTIGWVNSGYMGSFRDTLDNPALNLDITQTRAGRIKWGYVINLEQSLTDDVGLFGRWSWNDGKTEIMAFTDINASLSTGVSVQGKSWGRPDDTFGLAGAVNALSSDYRDFIAAGGTGVLIGDGMLNYHHERSLETYYAYSLRKDTKLTFDYQLITNPAYNADRGPVSVFTGRFHAEF